MSLGSWRCSVDGLCIRWVNDCPNFVSGGIQGKSRENWDDTAVGGVRLKQADGQKTRTTDGLPGGKERKRRGDP